MYKYCYFIESIKEFYVFIPLPSKKIAKKTRTVSPLSLRKDPCLIGAVLLTEVLLPV